MKFRFLLRKPKCREVTLEHLGAQGCHESVSLEAGTGKETSETRPAPACRAAREQVCCFPACGWRVCRRNNRNTVPVGGRRGADDTLTPGPYQAGVQSLPHLPSPQGLRGGDSHTVNPKEREAGWQACPLQLITGSVCSPFLSNPPARSTPDPGGEASAESRTGSPGS